MKNGKILIVDDREENLYIMRVFLENSGFEIEVAFNGAEALAKARQNAPDLIISDILMPVMDGFALCREWKKDRQLAPIPFIFYSATYTDDRDRQFALSLGAAEFLVKPIEPDELLTIVRDTINRATAIMQNNDLKDSSSDIPADEEIGYLKLYNETLIRKLESKMAQLERTNIELESQILERKTTESKLSANYDLLRIAGGTAKFGGWSVDLQTNVCIWSDAVADIHGMPRGYSPLVNDGINFYAPEWRGKMISVWNNCVENGIPYDEEMEIISSTGSRVWVRTVGEAERDDSGRIVKVHGAIQDVSECVKAQHRIEDLNSLLKAIRDVNQLIVQEDNLERLIRQSCEILLKTRQYFVIEIALLDVTSGLIKPIANAGEHPLRDWGITPEGIGNAPCCVRELTVSKEIVRIVETTEFCRDCPFIDEDRRHQTLLVPIQFKNELVGLLTVCLHPGHAISDEEIALLKEIAGDLGFARGKYLADDSLRRSESQFRSLFENTTIGIYRTTLDGRTLLLNPAMLKMIGCAGIEEIAEFNKNNRGYINESDAVEFLCRMDTDGYVQNFVAPWRKNDGSLIYIRESCHKVTDSEGNLLYFEGIAEDVTAYRQADLALRESEERYRMLIENTSDIAYYVDSTGLVQFVGPQIRRLGYKAEEMIGRNFLDYIYEEDQPYVLGKFTDSLKTGDRSPTEFRIKCKDGSLVWMEERGYLHYKENIIVGMSGLMRDITDRKRFEDELRASEDKFARAFQTSPYVITITRASDGKFIEVNEAFEKVTGYSRAEALENSSIWMNLWEKQSDREEVVDLLMRGETIRSREFLFNLKTGGKLVGLFSAQILSLKGEICVLSSINDITNRKMTEMALQESEEKFRSLFRNHAVVKLLIDPETGSIIDANEMAAKFYG